MVEFNLFADVDAEAKKEEANMREEKREKSLQHAMLAIRRRFGKNAILKGMNLEKGGTTISRNKQIGGHSE